MKWYLLIIDLKPAISEGELDKRIQKDFHKYINKDFKNSLDDLLPKKLIPVIIKLSNISEDKKVNEITKEERKKLVHLLKNFEFNIKGLRSLNEAIVTAGGVTGGYNVQIALSTGFLAGDNI